MSSGTTVQEFFHLFANQPVSIYVEDPISTIEPGFIGSKTFLSYKVIIKQRGRDAVGVRHRYSDFENLRKELTERYSPLGIFVPNLPRKLISLPSNSKAATDPLIKERVLGLSFFCEMMIDSPFLRNDKSWKDFMKSDSNPSSVVKVEDDNRNNTGELMLHKTLCQLEMPSKDSMQKKMVDIKAEALSIQNVVKVFLEQARIVSTYERSLHAANKQLTSSIANWIREEKNCTSYLGNGVYNAEQSRLKPHELVISTLEATSALLGSKTASQDLFPEHTSFSLVTALEQELANIESLKDLCNTHTYIASMIDALNVKLSKATTSKSSNRTALMADLTQSICEKELSLSAFYKGFCYFTLPIYARQRAASLRKLTGALAAASLTTAYSLQHACREFFASLNIKPSAAIADTSNLLNLLSMRPLEIPPDEITRPERPLLQPLSEVSSDLSLSKFLVSSVFDQAAKISSSSSDSSSLRAMSGDASNHSVSSLFLPPAPPIPEARSASPAFTLKKGTTKTGSQPDSGKADAVEQGQGIDVGVTDSNEVPMTESDTFRHSDDSSEDLGGPGSLFVNEKSQSLMEDLMFGHSNGEAKPSPW
jgi:hypothetical protein